MSRDEKNDLIYQSFFLDPRIEADPKFRVKEPYQYCGEMTNYKKVKTYSSIDNETNKSIMNNRSGWKTK